MKYQILFFILILFSNPSISQVNVYKGPIIDVHIHAFDQERSAMFFGMTHPPTLRGETYEGVTSAEEQRIKTIGMMEKHNVVKAVVSGGTLWYDHHPEKILIGEQGDIERLRSLHAQGKLHSISELSPFYAGMKADNPMMEPYYALAEELQIPIGFHILPGGPNGGIYTVGMTKMRAYNANPLQMEDVLVNHPRMKAYIMHGGWPYLEDMKALMYAHPQVYIDIAVINWIIPEKEFHNFLKGLVDAGFGDRIMFGSDQMTWPQTIEIGINAVNNAGFLTIKQKEDIFYNNAARFFGLSDEEIKKHKGK